MKKITFITFFLISKIFLAQNVTMDWAKGISNQTYNDYAYVSAMKIDVNGNIVYVGYFRGTLDFDPGLTTYTMTSTTLNNYMFISKLDAAGNFLWAEQIDLVPSSNFKPISLSLDNNGNIYITGEMYAYFDFDPSIATYTLDPNLGNAYVAKYNGNGGLLWAKQMGGLMSGGNYIANDNNNNVLSVGYYYTDSIVDFDPGPGTYTFSNFSNASVDGYVSKLDASGNFLWAHSIQGKHMESCQSISTDNSGNIFVIGSLSANDTIDFDPGPGISLVTVPVTSGWPMFLCKYDSQGNFIWVKQLPNLSNFSHCLDKFGNFYISGRFAGNADFDPGPASYTLNSISHQAGVVLKLNQNGDFVWVRAFDGYNASDLCLVFDIDVDCYGNVFTTGVFRGIIDFDPSVGTQSLTSNKVDVFLSKLDHLGNYSWIHKFGTDSIDYSLDVEVDANGKVLFAGSIEGQSADFDPSNCVSSIQFGGYVARFIDSTSVTYSPVNITPNANRIICNGTPLNISANGAQRWYSSTTSTFVLGTGTTYSTPALGLGIYTYYAEGDTICYHHRTAVTVTVIECTKINLNNELGSGVQLYPNPAKEEIYIETKSNILKRVEIFNCLGQLMIRNETVKEACKIDVKDLANGIYFIKIIADGKIIAQEKLIKE